MNLQAYLQKHGKSILAHKNHRFEINHPGAVWFVLKGQVDLFYFPREAGKNGRLIHLSRILAGECIFGFNLASHQDALGLIASPIHAEVFQLSLADFLGMSQVLPSFQPDRCIDTWFVRMTTFLAKQESPKTATALSENTPFQFEDETMAIPKKGVLWIDLEQGSARVFGRWSLTPDDPPFPLTPTVFLETEAATAFATLSTKAMLQHGLPEHLFQEFHHFLATELMREREGRVANEIDRILAKKQRDSQSMAATMEDFADIFRKKSPAQDGSPQSTHGLYKACEWVARAGAIELNPTIVGELDHAKDPIGALTRGANIRHRNILLTDGWWQSDGGAFLGFAAADERPVALLPKGSKSYELADPQTGERVPINRHNQHLVTPNAVMFYRPLPLHPLKLRDLLKHAGHGLSRELVVIFAMSIAAGIVGLVTPFATGIVFNRIIPNAAYSDLYFLGLGLIVIGLSTALFSITRNFALLRIEGKVDISLQAAIWDRIVSLPVPFFRHFASGDLVVRAMSIDTIRRTVSGTVITALLTGIFSIFYFLQLFYYSWQMALVSTGLVLFALVPMALGFIKVRLERKALEIQGTLSGLIIELINGVAKLRVSGAEDRAFVVWARLFKREKQWVYKARVIGSFVSTWNAMFSLFSMMVIFLVMVGLRKTESEGLSLGHFLAFIAAFSLFLTSVLSISNTVLSLLNLVPIYERARPILETEPEHSEQTEQPGELKGFIEVSRLAFRYVADGPKVLDDISFQVEPGQFVAVVGPSGSGKSTLFRMLLGFEKPESGAVYFDGRELAGLDIRAVRRQIGVVLQNGKLMPGSLFENIVGSLPLTIDDAWAAATMAGLDRDIRNMPMGMHTMISDSGGGLSGGQVQRLLIARALANKPRILFFDEATSALDNQTQAIVTKSLDALRITRIVIAHRLSTIMNADCIFVVDKGKLIERGNYQELLAKDGVFAGLVKLQIA